VAAARCPSTSIQQQQHHILGGQGGNQTERGAVQITCRAKQGVSVETGPRTVREEHEETGKKAHGGGKLEKGRHNDGEIKL